MPWRSMAARLMVVALLLSAAVVPAPFAAAGSTEFHRARMACDAKYNLPCARTNSQYLAWETARIFAAEVAGGTAADAMLERITAGEFNEDQGFYPFVFDAETSILVAHGERSNLVGHDLATVLDELHLEYASSAALHERFASAANTPNGEWVQYLWPTLVQDGSYAATSKLSYSVGVNREDGRLLCLGVGFADTPLPPELPCSSGHDTLCSIANVRSLVGKAATLLRKADSRPNFEEALLQLSYSEDYQLPGGFYVFTYSYAGPLMSHAHLHELFGQSLPEIFQALKRSEDGLQLHQDFVAAAEGTGDGWVRYDWRNSLDEDPYTKIAYATKVEFDGDSFYVGAGFNFVIADPFRGPRDEACPTAYNLPCALVNTLHLASHSLAHVVSSSASTADTFDAINDYTGGLHFKTGEFYVFIYDFNSTCVAHGAAPRFVGLTMNEVFDDVGIPLNATLLHMQFTEAAEAGGGWVQYDWANPSMPGSHFPKVSYIFKFVRDGREFYGGVGFTNSHGPVEPFLNGNRNIDGTRIRCSSMFGTACSETNCHSTLGQALSDLTMASEAKVTVANQREHTLEEILGHVTAGKYNFNDFVISVFAFDSAAACAMEDGSGCCIAHGSEATHVGKTWQQILDSQEVVSILGNELHMRLRDQASAGGGWVEYSWAVGSEGKHETKRALVAHFQSDDDASYYVLVDYFNTPLPPTCGPMGRTGGPYSLSSNGEDFCPEGMRCAKDREPHAGEFCVPDEPLSRAVVWLVWTLVVVLLIAALKQWRNHVARKNMAMNAELEKAAALKKAETLAAETMKQALLDQAAALELKKQGMTYPKHWAMASMRQLDDGTSVHMPLDGLIEVPQTSDEYWDVHDRMRQRPNPKYARIDPHTGKSSDLDGMQDAWITKLYRIQNADLWAYYDTQKERLKKVSSARALDSKGNVKEVDGWHGTGNFEAANIYEDRQDGFMMQFASPGQWGRGLYFAEESGYSHIYASKASHMPDGGYSKGMRSDESEFMLASLLVGDIVEMDRDAPGLQDACKSLRTPPSVNGTITSPSFDGDGVPACTAPPEPVPGPKYNTVRGYTQTDQRQPDGRWHKNSYCPRSKVWIVYENGRAYPQYLVRYYRGAFSSERLNFSSRLAARASTVNPTTACSTGTTATELSRKADRPTPALLPSLDSLDRLVPGSSKPHLLAPQEPSFGHVGPDGSTTPYDQESNKRIAEALRLNKPSVRLTDVRPCANTSHPLQFEVRFGNNAVSSKMSKPPASRMIQVNLANDFTRIVHRLS